MELTVDELLEDVALGVGGLLTAVQAARPFMRAGGRVTATGSMAADRPSAGAASLGVQKAGLQNLVRSLDTTLKPDGIRAVSVTVRGTLGKEGPFTPDNVAAAIHAAATRPTTTTGRPRCPTAVPPPEQADMSDQRVALVTGRVQRDRRGHRPRARRGRLHDVRRRASYRPARRPRARRRPHVRHGRHRRRLDGRRDRPDRRRARPDRRPRQQRRLRLLRRGQGRADRGGAAAVRGERVRPGAAGPARHAAHARAGSGRIINISSIGGKFYEPLGAWYHATKFAVEGFSDSLRLELAPFGIDVVIIEPGPIRTEWNTRRARASSRSSRGGAYEERALARPRRHGARRRSDVVGSRHGRPQDRPRRHRPSARAPATRSGGAPARSCWPVGCFPMP